MTTKNPIQPAQPGYRLPDPPRREPDEVPAFRYIYQPGSHQRLARHFGNPDTALVEYDLWIVASPKENRSPARRPDLLVAFDVSPHMYHEQNGYIISEQGKPPDFVMEVASPSTADNDTGTKRDEYATLGIQEYWRFDSTGTGYGQKLAGDTLEQDSYRSLEITGIAPDILQGYSPALNLLMRWDHGQLEWLDPATEAPIPSWDDADTRLRELEDENRRLRQQPEDSNNG